MTATKASKAMRLKTVEKLYVKGYLPRDIHEMVRGRFNCTYGTIRNDVVAIRKKWKEQHSEIEGFGEYSGEYIERLRNLMRLAVQKGDLATAHRIEKDIASVRGIAMWTGRSDVTIDADSRRRLDALLAVVCDEVKDDAARARILTRFQAAVADESA